jgi:Xaa-Pro aminopeptidase
MCVIDVLARLFCCFRTPHELVDVLRHPCSTCCGRPSPPRPHRPYPPQAHIRDGAAIVKLFSWMELYLKAQQGKHRCPLGPPRSERSVAAAVAFPLMAAGCLAACFPPCVAICCWPRVRSEDPALPRLTEYMAAVKSEDFRAEQPEFVSLSFPTIAGAGANGAIIHYRVP